MGTNIQSAQITVDLKLFPVLPLGWRTPVQPAGLAHGGLPHSSATPQGFQILIEPVTALLSWIVAAYDVVELVVNGVPTGITRTILPGEEGDRFLLHLPAQWLKNGVNKILYTVSRPSGNSDKSPELDVLFNNPVASVTVTHPASVTPGQTGTITITIGYARPYDTVTLTIGTWSITFTNFDDTKPITYTLTTTDLQQIGDGTHPVSATVIDQLSNSNVSPTTSIDIRTQDAAPDELEEFESVAEIYLRTVGQSVVSGTFTIRLLAARDKDYLAVRALDQTPHVKGMVIYPYSWDNAGSVTYVLKLNSGTSSRITFWMTPLNMPVNALMEARFMDASGIVLNTLQYRYKDIDHLKELFFDSRALTSIDSVVFVAQGQFAVDYFEIYR